MVKSRTVLHEMREDMPLQMVDVNERNTQRQCQPFGKRRTDEQGAQESRATGESNRREVGLLHSGTFESRIDHRQDILLMRPTR